MSSEKTKTEWVIIIGLTLLFASVCCWLIGTFPANLPITKDLEALGIRIPLLLRTRMNKIVCISGVSRGLGYAMAKVDHRGWQVADFPISGTLTRPQKS